MFGTNTIKSGLTFGKVLGGISKTLSIANQVIPLYQQAKPMINNAKTILSALKEFNSNSSTNTIKKEEINKKRDVEEAKITIETSNNSINAPTFFQ